MHIPEMVNQVIETYDELQWLKGILVSIPAAQLPAGSTGTSDGDVGQLVWESGEAIRSRVLDRIDILINGTQWENKSDDYEYRITSGPLVGWDGGEDLSKKGWEFVELRECNYWQEKHWRRTDDPYEYQTTMGQRKAWDGGPDLTLEGWEIDDSKVEGGWERFEYSEERYWKRLKK